MAFSVIFRLFRWCSCCFGDFLAFSVGFRLWGDCLTISMGFGLFSPFLAVSVVFLAGLVIFLSLFCDFGGECLLILVIAWSLWALFWLFLVFFGHFQAFFCPFGPFRPARGVILQAKTLGSPRQ